MGLAGSRGAPEVPRGRISDFSALLLLRLARPRLLVQGARDVVTAMLGEMAVAKPDLSLDAL